MNKAILATGLGVCALAFSTGHAHAADQQNADSSLVAPSEGDGNSDINNNLKSKPADNGGETGKSGVVNMNGLNLRVAPKISEEKIQTLDNGTEVSVMERKGGWARVQTQNGTEGWVSGYYVVGDEEKEFSQNNSASNNNVQISENQASANQNKNAQQDQSSEIKLEQRTGFENYQKANSQGQVVSFSDLNIRTGPGTSNSVVGTASKGQVVKIYEHSDNGWCKVMTDDGIVGWCSGAYINETSISGSDAESSADAKEDKNSQSSEQEVEVQKADISSGKVINTYGLNVRKGPGTGNEVVAGLKQGNEVKVLGQSNGWLKVELDDGSTGWVNSNYIGNSEEKSSDDAEKNPDADKKVSYSAKNGDQLVDTAFKYIGTRYAWGGTSPTGFDCSGFTQYVYRNALGKNIPRVSRDQARGGVQVSKGDYKKGDLVYFDTIGAGTTSHVGIYIGDGKFIHASGTISRPDQVRVDSLNSSYWSRVLLGARRY